MGNTSVGEEHTLVPVWGCCPAGKCVHLCM